MPELLSRETLAVFELIGDAVWVFDLERSETWWANQHALRLFAAPSLGALQQRQRKDTMTAGTRRRLGQYRQHFQHSAQLTERWTFYPGDQAPVSAVCTCTGVSISDGGAPRAAMLVHAREPDQALGDTHRLAEAVRHCNEWISLFTARGEGLLRNPAAEQALGLLSAAGGDAFQACFARAADAARAREQALSGAVYQEEVPVPGARWAETEVRQVVDPASGEPALLVVQHDVTARHAAGDRLERARQEAVALREVAERASRARSRFLGVMSHELRTPITGVLGATALLRDSSLDRCQRDMIGVIEDAGEQIAALVEDILEVSRLDAGSVPVQPEPIPIRARLTQLVRSAGVAAAQKSLPLRTELDGSLPERLLLDPHRLRQIMSKLLSNAIKFSTRGPITVRARWAAGTLTIAVADQGIGMQPEQVSALMDAFVQADASAQRAQEGAGLGLHIVKRITEALGGRLHVETALGEGSTFTVALPAPISAAAGPARPAPLDLRVLLVDDNNQNRGVLAMLLRAWGCTVVEADSGAAALSCASKHPIDAVLMDIWMPGMDGIRATELLRERDLVQGPIFALTADAELVRRQDVLFDHCIGKPFDHEALRRRLAGVQRDAASTNPADRPRL